MVKNPVLDLPIEEVVRPEIALVLSQVCRIRTVGGFLRQWRDPRQAKLICQAFDTPEQAKHAAATCSAWLGIRPQVVHRIPSTWWQADDLTSAASA